MFKQVFCTGAVTDTSAYDAQRQDYGDLEGVGTLRIVGDKVYRWVQNRHSAALTAGDVVYHTFSDAANAHKYVRDGATADLGFMAGVVASTTIATDSTGSAGDGGYGWILISGYYAAAAVLPSATTAAAAGATMIGADAVLTAAPGDSVAMGTAAKYPRHLLLLEAAATVATTAVVATTKKVWVNCWR